METLIFGIGIICGLLISVVGKIPQKKKEVVQQAQETRLQVQYDNFFNYDGTSNGQRSLEEVDG